jgi:hypothetical protein
VYIAFTADEVRNSVESCGSLPIVSVKVVRFFREVTVCFRLGNLKHNTRVNQSITQSDSFNC